MTSETPRMDYTYRQIERSEIAYAKQYAQIVPDPTGKVVILPLYSTSKMMLLAKEASND